LPARVLTQIKLINAIFLLLFLLTPYKSFSGPSLSTNTNKVDSTGSDLKANDSRLSEENFDRFVKKAEHLQDSSPNKAFAYIVKFESSLPLLPLEHQLIFYKLQSELYLEIGQYRLSKLAANRGLDLAKELSSPSIVITELLYARGFSLESLGDLDGALAEYINGLEVAESLNNKKHVAMGLINLGAIYYLTEDFEKALIVFNEALFLSADIDDDELKGYVSGELGVLYSFLAQPQKSMSFYQKSYEHYQKAGKIFYAYNSLRNIAFNHSQNERYDEAIEIYKKIIDNADDVGDSAMLATVYSGMAWAQLHKEDKDEEASYQYMLIASQYYAQSEHYDVPVTHAIDKGFLMLKMHRYQEALESANEASKNMSKYAESKGNSAATVSNLSILYLKSEAYYKLEKFQQAYHFQQQLAEYSAAVRKRGNIVETEDLRMRYESEQADLIKEILQQEKSLQTLLLEEGKQALDVRNTWLVVIAVISLVLAWVLIKVIAGQKQLVKATNIDGLTGITNRRRLMQMGHQHFKKLKNDNEILSLLIIDIDNFKGINAQYGHQGGDDVLRKIALIGKTIVRQRCKHKSALFGRLGGGEFIALLPEVNSEDSVGIAEQLRQSIEQFNWLLASPDAIQKETELTGITVSIGVASYNQMLHESFDSLIQAAELVLHHEKTSGKNKVCYV